ncbi:hypothetical protein ACF0H5_018757 [Mactra antiquata]
MAEKVRNKRSRFSKRRYVGSDKVILVHNYASGKMIDESQHPEDGEWRIGRIVMELGVLLDALRFCEECGLGPVPLTVYSVVNELKRGLSGYLYVKCSYEECGHVNKVPYGKTHWVKAMIDSVGGPNNVNNFLSTLNIPTINPNKLKKMECRAGTYIEKVAAKSTTSAAKLTFDIEMKDIALEETWKAEASMETIQPDLGVALLPDSSPNFRALVQSCTATADDIDWSDDDDGAENECHKHEGLVSHKRKKRSAGYLVARQKVSAACKRLVDRFKSHTFFMSKSKYGKKVLKIVDKHRTCGTCKWWKRNQPESKVRDHRCVHNHVGSARMLESASGKKGIMEMLKDGTPVEIVEGDGDNTLISRMKTHQNIDLKKRFDRNHVIKNIGKHRKAPQRLD